MTKENSKRYKNGPGESWLGSSLNFHFRTTKKTNKTNKIIQATVNLPKTHTIAKQVISIELMKRGQIKRLG